MTHKKRYRLKRQINFMHRLQKNTFTSVLGMRAARIPKPDLIIRKNILQNLAKWGVEV